MVRKMLTNRQWQLISPLLPGKASDPGRTSNSNRSTVEGIPWIDISHRVALARPAA